MKNATKLQLLAVCISVLALTITFYNVSKRRPPTPCPEIHPVQNAWIQGLVDAEAETLAGVRTVLTAMKPGESCLIPESIFENWTQDADGNSIVSDGATLLVYKDTSEVTQKLYLPAETPVWCTSNAATSDKPYVHLVKGPGDKRAWFQIRNAEAILAGYTMDCWETFRPERQARMVEVDLRR